MDHAWELHVFAGGLLLRELWATQCEESRCGIANDLLQLLILGVLLEDFIAGCFVYEESCVIIGKKDFFLLFFCLPSWPSSFPIAAFVVSLVISPLLSLSNVGGIASTVDDIFIYFFVVVVAHTNDFWNFFFTWPKRQWVNVVDETRPSYENILRTNKLQKITRQQKRSSCALKIIKKIDFFSSRKELKKICKKSSLMFFLNSSNFSQLLLFITAQKGKKKFLFLVCVI